MKKQQKNEKKNKFPSFAECRHSAKLGTASAHASFAECPRGTRQRIFQKKLNNLCRVPSRAALDKEFFKKKIKYFLPSALPFGTRQSAVS